MLGTGTDLFSCVQNLVGVCWCASIDLAFDGSAWNRLEAHGGA